MSILDQAAESHEDRLWLVTNRDGTREITDEANKAGRGGFAPAWNTPYRQVIAEMVKSLQDDTLVWLRIAAELPKGKQSIKGPLGERDLPGLYFIANGSAYTAYIGTHHTGRFLGFGGRKFKIAMKDGTEYESNNVWFGRDVPANLREILADTATMTEIQ
jgi:hypothetical protein